MTASEEMTSTVAYQSLYRRYRPQRFGEVRGQDHVALALRNAVRDGRVAHAYLFSGPRGTGKTSTARILAKALNCLAPSDGEPCGTCDSCETIAKGSSFDVHELDAASNNGVDAMRDLVARAALSTPGKWKVYIVDEVHMLSTAASNALLKTLEEPPEHVVFVLATTDPQKVLPTIRSRAQHFEFHLLNEQVLEALLDSVARDAEIDLPKGAIALALRRGRGSARDALSVLDQVIAAGVADDDAGSLSAILRGLGEQDVASCLGALDEAVRSGRDPEQLAVELVESLRNGFFSIVTGAVPANCTSTTAEIEAVRAIGGPRAVRCMEAIGAAIVDMRDAPQPRVTLEVALIRCSHPESDTSPEALAERLDRLERRLAGLDLSAQGVDAVPTSPTAPRIVPVVEPSARSEQKPSQQRPPADRVDAPAATNEQPKSVSLANKSEAGVIEKGEAEAVFQSDAALEDKDAPTRDELVAAWGDVVLASLRPRARAIYQVAHFVAVEDGEGLLAFPNEAHMHYAEPLRGEVVEGLSRALGRPVRLRLIVEGTSRGDTSRRGSPPMARGLLEAEKPLEQASAEHDAAAHGELDELLAEARAARTDEVEGDVATTGAEWARNRLLEAFPGAEELEG